jgi:DNA ligase-1
MPGNGTYAGQVSALRMELPDGCHFSPGSGLIDDLRRNPNADHVPFRELTHNGMPHFPWYLRIRVQL